MDYEGICLATGALLMFVARMKSINKPHPPAGRWGARLRYVNRLLNGS